MWFTGLGGAVVLFAGQPASVSYWESALCEAVFFSGAALPRDGEEAAAGDFLRSATRPEILDSGGFWLRSRDETGQR